jgi:site-specific recombinase XerC
MRWEHLNLDVRIYQNPKGKRPSSRRAVPLLYDSVEILRLRHLAQGSPASGWVFPAKTRTGHMMSIQKPFVRARDRAGLPKQMVLYTCRHGFGTDVGPKVGLRAIMEIMGHLDSKTALKYQHPDTVKIAELLQ